MSLQLPERGRYAYAVLVYYWVLIGLFKLDLPTIVSSQAVTWLTMGSLGWIACIHFDNYDDAYEEHCKRFSPQIMTEKGTFSWSGVLYSVFIGTVKYNMYYGNGCNYDGLYYEGDVCFICPAEQTLQMGKDVLIATEFKNAAIPRDIVFLPGTSAVLLGHNPSSCIVDSLEPEIAKTTEQVNYYTKLSNSYHDGFNRMVKLVNSHVDLFGVVRKVDDMNDTLKKIEAAGRSASPDRSPEFYKAIEDDVD